MFSFLRGDPVKKQTRIYHQKLEQAMYAQRNGDIRSYSMITAEAEKIREKISKLKEEGNA